MSLGFSELPNEIRVKLSEKGKKELWHRVDEFGGIKNFSQAFEYSPSKIYNWKNKDSYIPIEVIRKVFGAEATEEVTAYKGKGRSKPVQNPVIPLPVNNELLTRINCSVHISNGTPIYQANDKGLIERFEKLLGIYGDIPYKVYSRENIYELRYPKYLQKILVKMSYKKQFPALVDEKAQIKNGKIILEDQQKPVESFEGKLYSKEKSLKLALARNNQEKIRQLVAEEAEKAEKTFKTG